MDRGIVMLVTSKKQADACRDALEGIQSSVCAVVNTGGQITELDKEMPIEILPDGSIKENWVLRRDKDRLLEYLRNFIERGNPLVLAADGGASSEKIAFDLLSLLHDANVSITTLESVLVEDILASLSVRRAPDEDRARAEGVKRIIDILIGFRLSRAARWHLGLQGYDIPSRLSVGRVMAPALKLLCDNQKEIDSHVGEPFVRIKCWYSKNGEHFEIIDKTRFFEDSYEHQIQYKELKAKLASHPHIVTNYNRRQKEESPPPPLSLSELDMASFNAYRYSSETTSKIAEDIYLEGYITNYKTSSNLLNPDLFDAMIAYLYATLPEDQVVEIPRQWRKADEGSLGEYAVSPTRFEKEYEPDHIKRKWEMEGLPFGKKHLDIYRLIWYRTLATQVENAFFDVSELSLQIKDHRLKIIGNKVLVDMDDEGNEVERLGWLALNKTLLRKSMTISEDGYKTEEVVIPHHEVGEEAVCTDITDFNSGTQPPRHYGETRFIKTLERMGVAKAGALSMLAKKMEEQGFVEYRGMVLYVRTLGKRVNQWIETYAPFLSDTDEVVAVSQAIEEIGRGEYPDPDHLVRSILYKIQKVEEQIGYGEDERGQERPSLIQTERARQIAKSKGIRLGSDLFRSREKIEVFLRKYGEEFGEKSVQPELPHLGRCPDCGIGSIVRREKFYGCTAYQTQGCKFGLNIQFATEFLERFGKEEPSSRVLDALVKKMLSSPYAEVTGMISREGRAFTGRVALIKKNGYWNIGFYQNPSQKEA